MEVKSINYQSFTGLKIKNQGHWDKDVLNALVSSPKIRQMAKKLDLTAEYSADTNSMYSNSFTSLVSLKYGLFKKKIFLTWANSSERCSRKLAAQLYEGYSKTFDNFTNKQLNENIRQSIEQINADGFIKTENLSFWKKLFRLQN